MIIIIDQNLEKAAVTVAVEAGVKIATKFSKSVGREIADSDFAKRFEAFLNPIILKIENNEIMHRNSKKYLNIFI